MTVLPGSLSNVLASPLALEKGHFDANRTGLYLGPLSGAQACCKGAKVPSQCVCWWYSSWGWGAEHTPASSSLSAALPLPGTA